MSESDNDQADQEEILHELASRFCHVLIRPQLASTLNSHDRHPYRLIRDLISNVENVFSEDAIKAHEEYSNRRIIVATSSNNVNRHPSSTNNSSVKEPSLEVSSSAASTTSSIASTQLSTPTRETNILINYNNNKKLTIGI